MSLPSLQVLTPHPLTFCMLTFPFSSEWLDNDEDGCVDIPLVVSKVTFTSFLFLFSSLKCLKCPDMEYIYIQTQAPRINFPSYMIYPPCGTLKS